MKAIKLQRGNKLHHYWLSQYIKAIVLHQREFEFEFWPIRNFHFIQPVPVPSTILNYCPIRDDFTPPHPPPAWHRTLTSTLLLHCATLDCDVFLLIIVCTEVDDVVAVAQCEYFHWVMCNPMCSRNHKVWTSLNCCWAFKYAHSKWVPSLSGWVCC